MQQSSAFAGLLRTYRQNAGLSQNALARRVGVNPAYVNRLESGERRPSQRHYVVGFANALGLDEDKTNRLLEAAGQLPSEFSRVDARDPTVRLVADILGDDHIPAGQRDEFRRIIALVSRRWRPDQES